MVELGQGHLDQLQRGAAAQAVDHVDDTADADVDEGAAEGATQLVFGRGGVGRAAGVGRGGGRGGRGGSDEGRKGGQLGRGVGAEQCGGRSDWLVPGGEVGADVDDGETRVPGELPLERGAAEGGLCWSVAVCSSGLVADCKLGADISLSHSPNPLPVQFGHARRVRHPSQLVHLAPLVFRPDSDGQHHYLRARLGLLPAHNLAAGAGHKLVDARLVAAARVIRGGTRALALAEVGLELVLALLESFRAEFSCFCSRAPTPGVLGSVLVGAAPGGVRGACATG